MTAPDTRSTDVLVLGAGLQGSCVALALAALGHRVTVLDRAEQPMSGASRNTEGKIHLGYVYALDRSGATQRRMLTGALAFAPLLDRWLGPQPWASFRSPPFRYRVMPDSLVGPDELAVDYARTDDAVDEVRRAVETTIDAEATYLGTPLDERVHRDAGSGQASFSTPEVAIDPDALVDVVRVALAQHPEISVETGTDVRGAARDEHGYVVDAVRDGAVTAWRAPVVVSCLWEDRLRVDATVGVSSAVPEWTARVKHLVVVRPAPGATVDAVTMVQGPFGDVIPWRDGRICLSWYPTPCRCAQHRRHPRSCRAP